MAKSTKYGTFDMPKVRADEPVFVLRAQDELAGPTLEMYKALAASHGAAVAKTIDQEIDQFRQWKGPRKLPD